MSDEQQAKDDAELERVALFLEKTQMKLGIPLSATGLRPACFYLGANRKLPRSAASRRAGPPAELPVELNTEFDDPAEPRAPFRQRGGRPAGARTRAARGPHSRRCNVCRHPYRKAIEEEFLRWRSPDSIARDYKIADHSSIYRHAHATGIFARRRKALRWALGNIIECSETVRVTASAVVNAVRAFTHIDEQGEWVNHPTRHVVVVKQPSPVSEASDKSAAVSASQQPSASAESAKLNRQTPELEHGPTH